MAEQPARTPVRSASASPAAPPPQAVMGLLNYITATSLDEDYAHASKRKAAEGTAKRLHPGWAGMLVLAVFGALIAVAAVQTSREAPSAARRKEVLVKQVNAGKAALTARRDHIARLQDAITNDQRAFLAASSTGRGLQTTLDRLGIQTGVDPVRGLGVRVVVDDQPGNTQNIVLDKDLQSLVNGLWEVGAEAIAINGQRLTSLSAIRHAGNAITVDYRSLQRPYTVSAIGNPNTMAAKFLDTPDGQNWLGLQSSYGLRFSINNNNGEPLTLPAARPSALRYAGVYRKGTHQ
ncbi:MAG: DUF881 domain-containing protein [Nocardioidaceae bacterium]